MTNNFRIRTAKDTDRTFIFELSPILAEVAGMPWHSEAVVQKMQDDYFTEVFANTSPQQATFIAEQGNQALGFIRSCSRKDEISGEACATVPLLGVSPKAQGMGVGQALIKAAEAWAKEQGYRLLHLEVFAHNHKAQGFYQNLGFEPETLHMNRNLIHSSMNFVEQRPALILAFFSGIISNHYRVILLNPSLLVHR